jgi:membrane associated rhomboid family serine protease
VRKTNLLIVLCVLVTLLYWVVDPRFVEDYLIYTGDRLMRGAFWTPVTTLFVHFDLVHLVGNMMFLYVFGNVVEKEEGGNGQTTALAFLVGGVGSTLISSFYYGLDVALIGASGAIFALAAAAMLVKPLKLSFFFLFLPLGLVAILYFIFNVIAVAYEFGGQVGYVAHVAGFVIGIPFGIALSEGEWVKNLAVTILLLLTFLAIIYLVQLLGML